MKQLPKGTINEIQQLWELVSSLEGKEKSPFSLKIKLFKLGIFQGGDMNFQESLHKDCLPYKFHAAACYLFSGAKPPQKKSDAKKMAVGEALRRSTRFFGRRHFGEGCSIRPAERGSGTRNNGGKGDGVRRQAARAGVLPRRLTMTYLHLCQDAVWARSAGGGRQTPRRGRGKPAGDPPRR